MQIMEKKIETVNDKINEKRKEIKIGVIKIEWKISKCHNRYNDNRKDNIFYMLYYLLCDVTTNH